MTHEEIIRIAGEAGLLRGQHWNRKAMTTDGMRKFAALVAEKEREACAQLCEDRPDLKIATTYDWTRQVGQDLARAIRMRSNVEQSRNEGSCEVGMAEEE